MSFSKKIRQQVYEKYAGRCAYCGIKLDIKDMQVDHFISKCDFDYMGKKDAPEQDDISNLMPACRMCNHYKRAHSLKLFRRMIEEIPRKCRDGYIYKVGVRYGLIEEHEKPIKFFFEQAEGAADDST